MKNYNLLANQIIVITLFNVLLSVSAMLGNVLIIVAILRAQHLQTPSYLLITSLAFTDLLIGLVYHPYFTLINILLLNKNLKVLCNNYGIVAAGANISTFLALISILMNAFIGMDRYLALSLRHRYRSYVTKKRVRLIIISGWTGTALFVGALTLISMLNSHFYYAFGFSAAFGTLSITVVLYSMSFVTLHRYTSQVYAQQPNPLRVNFDVAKYRKTLKTMVAILGCFMICSSFLFAAVIAQSIAGYNAFTILGAMASCAIFGSCSSINPVIYFTRFKDIGQECKLLLKTFRC